MSSQYGSIFSFAKNLAQQQAAEPDDNYGMPANWAPINSAPIDPNKPAFPSSPASVDPYGSGPLPPNFGNQTQRLISTGYPNTTAPVPLMPVYGGPQLNAVAHSVATQVVNDAITNLTENFTSPPYTPPNNILTVTASAVSLASGAIAQSTLTMARSFTVLSVTCNGPLRLRLYSTAAAQTADLNRSNQIPPTPGTDHGVILDLYLQTSQQYLSWTLSPVAGGSNEDSPQTSNVYCSITNIGASPASLSAGITYAMNSQPN